MGWQRLPISALLRKSEDWVHPEPDEIYQQIRVRLWGKGLTLRAKIPGANIAANRQLRASAGQFLISRIDARHGAFGIVPDHLDGALVSNDFPCFDINDRIVLPRYLEWYSRTDRFVELCRRASEGSTNRVRLKEDRFMAMEISVPTLEEQFTITERLSRVVGLLVAGRAVIEQVERETNAFVSAALRKLVYRSKYQSLADVARLVRRRVEIDPNRQYIEVGVRSFYNGIFHRRTVSGSEFSWQVLYSIKQNDLVFSNLMAWEKAIAVASIDDDGCVANHRMLTCEVDPTKATPHFLLEYFKTEEGFQQIVGHSAGSIARNKTLSSKKLSQIRVPVPPIGHQFWFDRIVRRISDARFKRLEFEVDAENLVRDMLYWTIAVRSTRY